jgi:hypothetical protein
MEGEFFFNGISQVGFPIAAFWLMYDLFKKHLTKNTEAVNNLGTLIKACLK